MDQVRKVLGEVGWLTLGFAAIGAICDLVMVSLELGRSAALWP